MKNQKETLRVFALAKIAREESLKSTGASVVSYSGKVFNVDGSTLDPKDIPLSNGYSWKQLLIQYGIGLGEFDQCYVSSPLPKTKSSHPKFSVGGHMTQNPDGKVFQGDKCYLMPLCSWHNHKSRDGIAFSLNNHLILELSGYMEAESAAMFTLRFPSDKPYAALKLINGSWIPVNLSQSEFASEENKKFNVIEDSPEYSIYFKRDESDSSLTYLNEW